MQHVVIKFVLLIPKTDPAAAEIVHGCGNAKKMFEELGRDIFVNVIFHRELDRDAHQVEREHAHPTGTVALLEARAVRETGVAIEHADVVETEEAAFEN